MDILIVDDNEMARKLLRRRLLNKDVGANILESAESEEAINILKANHFDVVYTDLKLPKGSGFDVIKEAKKNIDTVVVVISAMLDDTHLRTALENGADRYLFKPLDLNLI